MKKFAALVALTTGVLGSAHAALPDSAAIVTSITADAAAAAGVGASVLAVVMPLSIGFALLVKLIKKGTKG